MTAPVRIGVVGLGWVGTARHVPTIRAARGLELVGVADRSQHRVDAFSAPGGIRASVGATLAEIDWIDEVEAVSIATAPFAHHALVTEALARGLHVITEKPFAMSPEEGRAMVEGAQQADRSLAVVHNFQFARSMARLLADLEAGRMGALRGVRALQLGNPQRRLPSWYGDLPFGLFYDESPHLLYLLQRVAGPMRLAKAVCIEGRGGQSTPQQVDAWFEAGLGLPVTLSCNFESALSEWYLLVHAERGVGVVDIFRDIYLFLPNDGGHGTGEVLRTSAMASWQHWLQHFTSGARHLAGRLRYGNDEVFDRFARAVRGDAAALEPIGAANALGVLTLQHEIISKAERLSL